RVDVLQEDAGDELLAPGLARAREHAGVVDDLVGLARRPPRVAAGAHEVFAEAPTPLERAARRGRRHALVERERLGVAVGGLRGERGPELLVVREERQPPLAVGDGAEPAADRDGAVPGAVELEGRAVAALLVVVGAG